MAEVLRVVPFVTVMETSLLITSSPCWLVDAATTKNVPNVPEEGVYVFPVWPDMVVYGPLDVVDVLHSLPVTVWLSDTVSVLPLVECTMVWAAPGFIWLEN